MQGPFNKADMQAYAEAKEGSFDLLRQPKKRRKLRLPRGAPTAAG